MWSKKISHHHICTLYHKHHNITYVCDVKKKKVTPKYICMCWYKGHTVTYVYIHWCMYVLSHHCVCLCCQNVTHYIWMCCQTIIYVCNGILSYMYVMWCQKCHTITYVVKNVTHYICDIKNVTHYICDVKNVTHYICDVKNGTNYICDVEYVAPYRPLTALSSDQSSHMFNTFSSKKCMMRDDHFPKNPKHHTLCSLTVYIWSEHTTKIWHPNSHLHCDFSLSQSRILIFISKGYTFTRTTAMGLKEFILKHMQWLVH